MDPGLRITLWGLAGNVVLAGLKFAVGVFTGSVALVADGVHSLTDLATDLVVLGGLRFARRPADRSHAFGHGKFETLSAGLVAVALGGAAGWIAWEAWRNFRLGGPPVPGPVVAAVAALSIAVKEWMYQATVRTGRRLRSTSLEANAWHHRSDALSSVAVLVGGLVGAFGYTLADPVAAWAVAVLIAGVGLQILWRVLHELTEGALTPAEQDRVVQAITHVPGVENWHKLRTRSAGREAFVDVHVQVNPELSVEESHAIASRVEQAVAQALGGEVSVTVHIEPNRERP